MINELDKLIVLQCAPLLANLKIANLLIVKNIMTDQIYKLFLNCEIDVFCMGRTEYRTTFFLYRKEQLKKYLELPENKQFLDGSGYYGMSIDNMLELCSERYRNYLEKGGRFPHEIGVFLGYPVNDVTDFVKNKGKNSVYTGYWKVYHDLNDAIKTFEGFNKAVDNMLGELNSGRRIQDITMDKR